jgi:hypothetical protein
MPRTAMMVIVLISLSKGVPPCAWVPPWKNKAAPLTTQQSVSQPLRRGASLILAGGTPDAGGTPARSPQIRVTFPPSKSCEWHDLACEWLEFDNE